MLSLGWQHRNAAQQKNATLVIIQTRFDQSAQFHAAVNKSSLTSLFVLLLISLITDNIRGSNQIWQDKSIKLMWSLNLC